MRYNLTHTFELDQRDIHVKAIEKMQQRDRYRLHRQYELDRGEYLPPELPIYTGKVSANKSGIISFIKSILP